MSKVTVKIAFDELARIKGVVETDTQLAVFEKELAHPVRVDACPLEIKEIQLGGSPMRGAECPPPFEVLLYIDPGEGIARIKDVSKPPSDQES